MKVIIMTDIRARVDSAFMEALRAKIGAVSDIDVTREAYTLLNWAADEAAKGRVILSSNKDGTGVERLGMRCLKEAESLAKT